MSVVGHHNVSDQFERQSLSRFSERFNEEFTGSVALEDWDTPITN
jgi:hypothetical protein